MSIAISRHSKRAGLAILGCALALVASPASAEILARSANVSPQSAGCGAFVVDLNGPGVAGNTLPFTLPASATPRTLAVLFNGECSVAAADDTTFLDTTVQLLNPAGVIVATLAPSNSDNAFCTSTGDAALHHWVSASTDAHRVFGAGAAVALQVRVIATTLNCVAGETWRLDDLSTIVMR
jgi:hypothetical protein